MPEDEGLGVPEDVGLGVPGVLPLTIVTITAIMMPIRIIISEHTET